MDYSAKSNLSLIKPCVEMCCRIPFVAESPRTVENIMHEELRLEGEIYSRERCPETKIDNFQDKARKASFFDCGSIKVYLFVFAFLLSETRISRSRKAVSRGCVHLGGQVKALESPIKRIASLFSMSSANFHPHLFPLSLLAFAGASLKSGMTLENNRLSTSIANS